MQRLGLKEVSISRELPLNIIEQKSVRVKHKIRGRRMGHIMKGYVSHVLKN